jgi:glucosamine--fructose-6-phosphate aminotransferase (isomerizing)
MWRCDGLADTATRQAGSEYILPVPRPGEPLLAPLLSVVPGQLFAGAVPRAKRLDPDRPRSLSKVTLAG